MIDGKELAVCKRRGHAGVICEGWTECKWCKNWVREVRRLEEREDEPAEEEMDISLRTDRKLEKMKRDQKDLGTTLLKKQKKDSRRPQSEMKRSCL